MLARVPIRTGVEKAQSEGSLDVHDPSTCSLLLHDLLCWCHLVMFSISQVHSACFKMSVQWHICCRLPICDELHQCNDAFELENCRRGLIWRLCSCRHNEHRSSMPLAALSALERKSTSVQCVRRECSLPADCACTNACIVAVTCTAVRIVARVSRSTAT